MTKKKDDSKLSPIGQRAEKVISAVLKDIEADARVKDATKRRYTLTDVMKVIDRAAKFEAIRAKLSNDDEGAFSNNLRKKSRSNTKRKGQKMNMHDMGVPDISALVRFGKLGMQMMAARILSILALCGFFALSFYTVYLAPSWQGAVVCGIAAIVSMAAVRAESAARQAPDGGAPNA